MSYLDHFFLNVTKFIFFLISCIPKSIRNIMGDFLGVLWIDILRVRRKSVLEQLTIAFPEMSEKEKSKLARASLKKLGRNFMSYAEMPFLDSKDLSGFRIENREIYDKALAQGKGVCLLTLHMGNVDKAATGVAMHGYKIHVISKLLSVNWLNELWFGMREKAGMFFIPPRGSSYGVLKALKKKETVVFVLDQYTGIPYGAPTYFFGKRTGTSIGLATIVQRSKSPVIPVYSLTDPDGTVVIIFDEEIKLEEQESRDQTAKYMTQVYTTYIESLVRKHPAEWMWIHRRWKDGNYYYFWDEEGNQLNGAIKD